MFNIHCSNYTSLSSCIYFQLNAMKYIDRYCYSDSAWKTDLFYAHKITRFGIILSMCDPSKQLHCLALYY